MSEEALLFEVGKSCMAESKGSAFGFLRAQPRVLKKQSPKRYTHHSYSTVRVYSLVLRAGF